MFCFCWKPLADGICPKTPSHPSAAELIIFTLREKNSTSLPLLCMQVKKKKAGHLKPLLVKTFCCSYGTWRGREIPELTVQLRSGFSGSIKNKLSHHSSQGGKGNSETPAFNPPPTSCPFPPEVLTLRGIANTPGAEAVLHSLLLLVR